MNHPIAKIRNFRSLPILLFLILLAGCQVQRTPAPYQPVPEAIIMATPGQPTDPAAVVTESLPMPAESQTPQATLVSSLVSLPEPNSADFQLWLEGLDLPVDLAFPANRPDLALILQQRGTIRVAQNGQLLSGTWLDLTGQAVRDGNEQGLLGIALDPAFETNRYFYLNYTDWRGDTIIARFQAAVDFLSADPASQVILLRIKQPFANHNGGALAFGPDGLLYIALGDGGSANDPRGNGQNLNSLLGKILRLDVRSEPYAIPADNPYINGGGKAEIWAAGLRNPWRISFDRLTGDLYIADVGQGEWEEVNVVPAGAPGGLNFGWNYREGAHPFKGNPPADLALAEPVAEYSHAEGGCSITGGYVYRGSDLPAYQGVYLYADYCTGNLWGLAQFGETWQTVKLFATPYNPSSFGQDSAGELYLLDHSSGQVFKLAPKP